MVRVSLWKVCRICGALFEKPPNCSRRVWREGRPCCSLDCGNALKRGRPNPKLGYWRGRNVPVELVAKRTEGRLRALALNGSDVGKGNLGSRREQTSQWKGDDIGYRAAHSRLYRERGRPESCSDCNATGVRIEWALRRDAEVVTIERGKRYSPRPGDYFPLCCRCHSAYDGRERHPVTGRWL